MGCTSLILTRCSLLNKGSHHGSFVIFSCNKLQNSSMIVEEQNVEYFCELDLFSFTSD